MGYVRLESEERAGCSLELRVLSGWRERLRGLIGAGEDAPPVLIARCGSIHTFGMGRPIDVALVGERGEVLRARRGLPPREFFSHPEARCALERPARDDAWPEEGEHLWVSSVSVDAVDA